MPSIREIVDEALQKSPTQLSVLHKIVTEKKYNKKHNEMKWVYECVRQLLILGGFKGKYKKEYRINEQNRRICIWSLNKDYDAVKTNAKGVKNWQVLKKKAKS